MSNEKSRSVEDFFDVEYRDYAIYTIENRAIPSMVDGFKPSQRKIIFAANLLWKGKKGKPMKVFQLGGQAAALSFFHHGSLDNTIINMVQDFKNNMPLFEPHGQFGSLRATQAGAPRYVGVSLNPNFKLLYQDFDLVTPQYEEGEEIEPLFFLPILPTVLLNGTSGIAVGFATKILNRQPIDLLDSCVEVLKTGACTHPLRPWVKGFSGRVEVEGEGRTWAFHGEFKAVNTTTVSISEIPPSFTYESYEKLLTSLVEKGVLVSYEDHSDEQVRYLLKFTRRTLARLVKKNTLGKTLKMRTQETENITCLGPSRELCVYKTAQDLVKAFVALRMTYYVKRKAFLLKTLGREVELIQRRAAFIKAVIDGRIVVANSPKKTIVAAIQAEGIKTVKGSYEYLLSMPIYSLTKEKYNSLLKKGLEKEAERNKVENTSPKDMYLTDLKDLRKHLKKSSPPVPKKVVKKKRATKKKVKAEPKSEYESLFK